MDIFDNPFWILGVTLRDKRLRIMELAEEKSLHSEEEIISSASSTLTNPRRRLGAEIAWLPGLGPTRANDLVSMLQSDPDEILVQEGIPPLAKANLLAGGLKLMAGKIEKEDMSKWIVGIAETYDEINADDALNLVNEDRGLSSFPKVTDEHALEAEIDNRRQHFKSTIRNALNQLNPNELVEVLTEVVEEATDMGALAAPLLVDDLVDTYEVEKQNFLNKEEEKIDALLERIKTLVDGGALEKSLSPLVDELIKVVKNWDIGAQPIQVSTKSRGLDHDASTRVALKVRSVAIDLFNEHDKLVLSWKMTAMLKEVFAEVVEVAELIEKDLSTLEGFAKQRNLGNLAAAHRNKARPGVLSPISSAPPLFSIYGFGLTLYGRADSDPKNGSYIATYYFIALLFPIFPIARYRVIENGTSYRFLGKTPFRSFDKVHLAVSVGLIAIGLLLGA